MTAAMAAVASPQAGSSAWRALLERNPSLANDASVDWRQRLILHLLTLRPAEAYFSGQATAEELILSDGRTLAGARSLQVNPQPRPRRLRLLGRG